MNQLLNRRDMLKAAAVAAAPAIITTKRTAAQEVIGSGDFKYRCQHQFPQLPDSYTWQITHNVAVDPDNNLYVIHEGQVKLADHPSIFVFDSAGKFIRAFGEQFQGGGHGLEIRLENGTPYLYVAAYQQLKSIAKLTLHGEIVWQQYAPMQSQQYAAGEASNPRNLRPWTRQHFQPTNFAFLPNGEFLLADGYGSYFIHRYDIDGNWLSCFGGSGNSEGQFNLPHGVWVDTRAGSDPEIVVADRAHNQLQVFSLDGVYKKTVDGFGLPANVDTNKELMLVPELVARVSLLDRNHNTVATIGDDRE
jgi:hypothetical protein